MDLPKVFGIINHGLLLAKLEVYGFSTIPVKTLQG